MINIEQFLNKVAKRRGPSAIRSLMPLTKLPGMISFAGGLPNASAFPFQSCTMTMKDGTQLQIPGEQMAAALQYGPTDGLPEFVSWIKNHQQTKHAPPIKDWNVVVTTGSQDALCKTFEMLVDEQDLVLVENPTYPGALAALKPLAPEILAVDIDGNGLIPQALQHVLEQRAKNGLKMPKFLYLIPTGQNPSGATLTLERKKQIYALAQKYNFLILEDDPYYYLTLDKSAQADAMVSFLSMDVDGRVLRFDSLSKVLSSGLRLGWVTGSAPLVTYLNYHMQASELHTSSLSQTVALALLQQWGPTGFDNHVAQVQELYRKRRDDFVQLVDKHLQGLVEYSKPGAGMFLWMKLKNTTDSKALIETKAREKLVLLVPGQAFEPHDKPTAFVRASFSVESLENMDKGLDRFAKLLKE